MKLIQHLNGYYYCHYDRKKRVSLKTKDREEAEKEFAKLKPLEHQNKFRDIYNRSMGFRSDSFRGDGEVYFVQCSQSNLIKIGHSINSTQRKTILQTGNPFQLNLLGIMGGFSIFAEQRIHHIFRDNRRKGEWFDPHPSLLYFIRINCD